MLRKINELRTQKGSMMIEALAMLGLISMVTPVIYKKAAERTTEMQDINAASQVRTVVKAIDDYLRDNYGTITGGGEVTSSTSTVDYSDFAGSGADTKSKVVNINHFKDYLPLGFQPDGKLFKGFDVAIKQVSDDGGRKALTTVLIAKTSTDGKVDPSFTKIRSSRIASMIGTNGGYIDGDKATGVQGVWEIPKSELPSSADTGTIVATSIEAVADGTAGGSDVLHRVHVDGHPEYNVMETTLSMNNNTIDGLHELISHGNTIKMRQQTESNALTLDVSGSGLFEDTLEIGDALSKGNRFYADRDVLAHSKALYIGEAIDGRQKANAAFYVDGSDGSFHAAKSQDETDPKFEVDGSGNTRADGTLKAIKLTDRKNFLNTVDYGLYATEKEIYLNPKSWFRAGIGTNAQADRTNALNGTGAVTGAGLMAGNTNPTSSVSTIYGQTINNYTPSFNVKYNNAAGTADFYNGLAKFTGLGGYEAANIPDTNKVTFNANAFIDGGFGAYKLDADRYNLTVDSEATVESTFRAGATGSADTSTQEAYNLNLMSNDATLESGMSFDRFSTGAGTAYGTTIGSLGNIGGISFGHGLKTGYNSTKGSYQAIFGERDSRIGFSDTAQFHINSDNSSIKMHTYGDVDQKYQSEMALKGDNLYLKNVYNKIDYKTAQIGLDEGQFYIGDKNTPMLIADSNTGLEENAKNAPIFIRQGVIEIAPDYTTTDASGNTQYAHFEGIMQSYGKTGIDESIDYTGKTTTVTGTAGATKPYDRFFVNPAYTSMMNDIKLATRGGARLSDILPDFINKGIYVMDNTFQSGHDWTKDSVKSDSGEFILSSMSSYNSAVCNNTKCDTSPWMGFIPTPNCPPGYMKVATITPIRFNMAQAGTTNRLTDTASIEGLSSSVDKDHYRALYIHRDPRGDDNLVLVDAEGSNDAQKRSSNTFVALPVDNLTSGSTLADQETKIKTQGDSTVLTVKQATIINQPYNYQINTWLNTTLKAYKVGGTDSGFKGWHGIMGFIYPADDYRDYYNAAFGQTTTSNSSEIFWNLFPVYKQELSAIATVYCYFDRSNANASFNNAYVDNYLPHEVDIGNIRNENKSNASNKDNLNDSLLPYNSLW